MNEPVRNVLLNHVSGVKVNKIDSFAIIPDFAIQLGRQAGNDVCYDASSEDMVSRRHAVIRIADPAIPSFLIVDEKSANGLFINGKRVEGQSELLPDDVVQLGKGGPKFVFDVQPRPASLASRTRVMSAVEMATTRVVAAAQETKVTASSPASATTTNAEALKSGVGKDTVVRMLKQERRDAGRSWAGIAAAVVAFVVVGAGALYWRSENNAQTLREESALREKRLVEEEQRAREQQQAAMKQELGTSARSIYEMFGNSTVQINFRWALYDTGTGKPLYQKYVRDPKDRNITYPAFVIIEDGSIVPWLTIEDEGRQNQLIGSAGSGSGFVVSEQGFILTNKHVASSWMVKYGWPTGTGAVFALAKSERNFKMENYIKYPVSALPDKSGMIRNWVPEQDKGIVFSHKAASKIFEGRTFLGRNESLEIRFPGSRLGISGNLVRASTDADVALLKVDSPQALKSVPLAQDNRLTVGDRVTVMGYPAVSVEMSALIQTSEGGRQRSRREAIPETTVTEGIISNIGTENKQNNNVSIVSDLGDVFQLSINATGAGNSGGPVFDNSGHVIGLFTYGVTLGGATATFAVPVKYGRELLQPQR